MSHARRTIICACTCLLIISFFTFTSKGNEENFNEEEIEIETIIETEYSDLDETVNYDNTDTCEVTTESEESDVVEEIEEIEELNNNEETEIEVEIVKKEKIKVKEVQNYISKYVPSNNSFKSYMSYKAITSKSSPQYKLQQQAYTGEHGLRMYEGRYLIALGSYYTSTIGTKIDIVMANGAILKCILGDQKANIHTCSQNIRAKDGSIVEFIVDKNSLHKTAKQMGNISYAHDKFKGEILEIRVYE